MLVRIKKLLRELEQAGVDIGVSADNFVDTDKDEKYDLCDDIISAIDNTIETLETLRDLAEKYQDSLEV